MDNNRVLEIKKSVMEVFDTIATSYSYTRVRGWDIVLKVVNTSTQVLCDVGSGPGQNTLFILKRYPHIYAISIDISIRMLLISRKRALRKKLHNTIDFIQADMEFLPIRDMTIDSMLYIASVHHIPTSSGRKRAIEEIHRCLKPRGRALIIVWAFLQPRFIKYIIKNFLTKLLCGKCLESIRDVYIPWRFKGKNLLRYYHLFTLRELVNLVKSANFKVVEKGTYNIHKKIYPENYYVIITK